MIKDPPELKVFCPFCKTTNSEHVVTNEMGPFYRNYCHNCGSAGPIADYEEEAVKLWDKAFQ